MSAAWAIELLRQAGEDSSANLLEAALARAGEAGKGTAVGAGAERVAVSDARDEDAVASRPSSGASSATRSSASGSAARSRPAPPLSPADSCPPEMDESWEEDELGYYRVPVDDMERFYGEELVGSLTDEETDDDGDGNASGSKEDELDSTHEGDMTLSDDFASADEGAEDGGAEEGGSEEGADGGAEGADGSSRERAPRGKHRREISLDLDSGNEIGDVLGGLKEEERSEAGGLDGGGGGGGGGFSFPVLPETPPMDGDALFPSNPETGDEVEEGGAQPQEGDDTIGDESEVGNWQARRQRRRRRRTSFSDAGVPGGAGAGEDQMRPSTSEAEVISARTNEVPPSRGSDQHGEMGQKAGFYDMNALRSLLGSRSSMGSRGSLGIGGHLGGGRAHGGRPDSASMEAMGEEYETFTLRVIHRRRHTGFEECKDFPVQLGEVIAGRYQVIDKLGSAAFSTAIQTLDLQNGTMVCMKIIKNNKDFFDQSLDEIKLLKYVNSCDPADEKHILRLFDYFYHREHLFIVCELLQSNLYEWQKSLRERTDAPYFVPARLQRIARQVLEGLAFIHSLGLIHCDLKPENILIRDPKTCDIKVIDLGSSCFLTDHLSSYVQSRNYRAPEVIIGAPYSQGIDIWSLGCILAELWSGVVLFQNDGPASLLARVVALNGPFPPTVLEPSRHAHKYFTRQGRIFERGEDERFSYLVPKRTTLASQMPGAPKGLVAFVEHLLTRDPEERPTAAEALKHPWLAEDLGPIEWAGAEV